MLSVINRSPVLVFETALLGKSDFCDPTILCRQCVELRTHKYMYCMAGKSRGFNLVNHAKFAVCYLRQLLT